MTVFVKMLDGSTESFVAYGSWLVLDLKAEIREKVGIPTDQQRLMFGGKQLKDEKTLGSYGVVHESTLNLLMRLAGGGKRGRFNVADMVSRQGDPDQVTACFDWRFQPEMWFAALPLVAKQRYYHDIKASNRSIDKMATLTVEASAEWNTLKARDPHF